MSQIEQIAAWTNLREAWLKALRGKRRRADARAFGLKLDENLAAMRRELLTGTWSHPEYHTFTIHDPKERVIYAPSFRDRVLHHAVMNICEPVIERRSIYDSYACRKGKGREKAVLRAQDFSRRFPWFLKMDVRKFFDSIDHDVLQRKLDHVFRERQLHDIFHRVLISYETESGKGLPIGSLMSQHFANFYLECLDRYVKEELRYRGYVRYMDDFVIWGGERQRLKDVRGRVSEYLREELSLEPKQEGFINRSRLGMDFLGYRIFPGAIKLSRRSKARFSKRLRHYGSGLDSGVLSEGEFQQRSGALVAFTLLAESWYFRRGVLKV